MYEVASLAYTISDSPVGPLRVVASDRGVREIIWAERPIDERPAVAQCADHPIVREAVRQLDEYFSGARQQFDLPLDIVGTPFQLRVWEALREIPFGETRSYLQLAQRLGDVKAIRAVGTANGRNPVVIVIPCHRVIGSDGKLVGFGGGLPRKATLLSHESAQLSLL